MCKLLTQDIDTRQLRKTLGQFPTGVAVVTTVSSEGQPYGLTINSFSSISLTPALIGWSIDRRAGSYAAFAKTERFAITILNENQEEIARRFARKGIDKFRGINHDPVNPIVIPGGSAWFQCQTFQRFLLGDHLLLVGRVLDSDVSNAQPLVFARGEFHNLPSPQPALLAATA